MILDRKALKVPIKLNTRKPRILLDMDDVIVDFLGAIVKILNDRNCTNYTIDQCKTWNLAEHYGEESISIMKEEGFFLNLRPKNDSIEVIKRMYLCGKYDIRIVTASMPNAYKEKLKWIRKHMPFFNEKHFVSCNDKSSVWGDILIDDAEHNLIDFAEIGEGIIYDMPHNQGVSGCFRVFNLKDAEDYIEDIFYSKDLKQII
ncbi:5' nucleotidase, NT5C type [Alkaliphilus sp. B6464]|uniref:5' nucleotidase, NT5C type n=1 Tax=Alkaliphilus sp. B6464 TaxID=2731219 RepID=UPI001BA6A165|nr:hypothetical protein [Alkaliphilus sp. B6464]QUH21784.1 hypothetical protein HYG84_17770 [Alkaliphilus sp. B6464]